VKGSRGQVTAVFSSRRRRGRVRLVVTTAQLHGMLGIRAQTPARRLAQSFPRRRRIASGLYRASPRSRRIIGTRRGKVRFIGVADTRLLRSGAALRNYLRLARR
jgi:hypothetical protein